MGLPKVFVNKINEKIKNNRDNKVITNDSINIDDILDKNTYSFNHRYNIIMNDGRRIESAIISKSKNMLLTIDNDVLNIKDILSIREIKK